MKLKKIVTPILIFITGIIMITTLSGCGALVGLIASVFSSEAGFACIPLLSDEKISSSQTDTSGMIIIKDDPSKINWQGIKYAPLNGVNVHLEGTDKIAVTDEKGYFLFSDIPDGMRKLTAEKSGYISVIQEVPIGKPEAESTIPDQFFISPSKDNQLTIIQKSSHQFYCYGKTGDAVMETDDVTWKIYSSGRGEENLIGVIDNNTGLIWHISNKNEQGEDKYITIDQKSGLLTSITSELHNVIPEEARPGIILNGTYPLFVEIECYMNKAPEKKANSLVVIAPESGSLEGTVYADYKPVSGVKIEITGTSFFTVTDGKGHYFLPEVPAGSATVVAQYQSQSASTITKINPGTTTTQDINLTSSPGSTFIYRGTIGESTVSGSDNNHLNRPEGLAIDSSGNLYISDAFNNRIQKFDINNNYIGTLNSAEGVSIYNPSGLTVDSQDNLYVSDGPNDRIIVFDKNGNVIRVLKSKNGQLFNEPLDVAVDSSGNIFISDYRNFRISKVDSGDNLLQTIGSSNPNDPGYYFGSFAPDGLAIDKNDNIYTGDSYQNHRVQIYDSSGKYIATIGELGKIGSDDYHFYRPGDIAFDCNENIFITDTGNHRVQVYDRNRKHIDTAGVAGIAGNTNDKFNTPLGVAINPVNGKIYIADTFNHRVQIFTR